MFESIANFFTKMGDKSPELCLIMVFTLLLICIFLYFLWKWNSTTQVLFQDYKETVKVNTAAIVTVSEVIGAVKEAIHKCAKVDTK